MLWFAPKTEQFPLLHLWGLSHAKGLVDRVRYTCDPSAALHSISMQLRKPAGLCALSGRGTALAACLLERFLAAPLD